MKDVNGVDQFFLLSSQVFVGSVMVRVIEIDTEQGFAFNSCNTCFGAASKDGSKFYCGHCDCVVTATPRFDSLK